MIGRIKIARLMNNARNLTKEPKITIGKYIIKSLIDKNVNVAFGSINNYSPILKIAKREKFDIILENHEENSAYGAVTYSRVTNNLGVIINNSSYGFANISKPIQKASNHNYPLLLLSFFDETRELKTTAFPGDMRKYIKKSVTIKKPENFNAEMEEILSYCFEKPAGPVHLNISNTLLDKPVFLNSQEEKEDEEEEEENLLQHLEKQYKHNIINPNILPKEHPSVKFSREVCKMYIDNSKKQNLLRY